jgi:hypothetical protein
MATTALPTVAIACVAGFDGVDVPFATATAAAEQDDIEVLFTQALS